VRTSPEAVALREAARAWDAACRTPPVDANDSATAKAHDRLLAAAVRFAAAARRRPAGA
jgi:hypothetical protein